MQPRGCPNDLLWLTTIETVSSSRLPIRPVNVSSFPSASRTTNSALRPRLRRQWRGSTRGCPRRATSPRGHTPAPTTARRTARSPRGSGRSGHRSDTALPVDDDGDRRFAAARAPPHRHVVDVEPGIADDGFDECCDLVTVWRHDFLPCPAVYAVHAQRCARCAPPESGRWHDCRRAFPVPPRPAARRRRLRRRRAVGRRRPHRVQPRTVARGGACRADGTAGPAPRLLRPVPPAAWRPPAASGAALDRIATIRDQHAVLLREEILRLHPASESLITTPSESASPSGSPSGPTTGPVSDGSLDAFRADSRRRCGRCPDGRHRRQRLQAGLTASISASVASLTGLLS